MKSEEASYRAESGFNVLNDNIPSLADAALSERLCISLRPPSSNGHYPTSKIQKGPVLVCGSADLSGEGVGLGVPIAKFARHVFFPGKARIIERLTDDQLCTWIVDSELNLEERLTLKSGKKIQSENFYALKEWFAGLHKAIDASRGLIEWSSSALRRTWGLSTTFEPTRSVGNVHVSYTVDSRAQELRVTVDASRLNKTGCSEIILLNELDGGLFDRYSDVNGLALVGKAIGTWEETAADCVTLIDSRHNITLHFRNVAQSTMYRGREVVPGRLSWAGIAYVIAPPSAEFNYDIAIREDI
ncbi:MAG: hypothetical protein ACXW1O_04975 [Halobacteriota archaeon]